MQVLKDKSDLSRWTLKYSAFGQNLEYSWLAKNLQARVASTLFVIVFYYKKYMLGGFDEFFFNFCFCAASPEPENTLDFSGRPSQQVN